MIKGIVSMFRQDMERNEQVMRKLALSDELLLQVQKPARYLGNEMHAVYKDRDIPVRFAMCFPDTYEIGMSNLGVRILYGVMNETPGVWCERSFAPWGDMEVCYE